MAVKIEPISANEGCTRLWKAESFGGIFEGLGVQPHLDGGQVLLDRLRRAWMLFDVGRDVHRRDESNVVKVLLGPRQKLSAGRA